LKSSTDLLARGGERFLEALAAGTGPVRT